MITIYIIIGLLFSMGFAMLSNWALDNFEDSPQYKKWHAILYTALWPIFFALFTILLISSLIKKKKCQN